MSVSGGASADTGLNTAGMPVPEDATIAVAILQSSDIAIMRMSDITVTYANAAHTALFGWRAGDKPLHNASRPDGAGLAGQVLEAAAKVLDTGEAVQLAGVEVGDRFLHIVCSPVRDQSTTHGVSVVSIDISEQTRERRRVELRHDRLSLLDEATSAVTAEREPRGEFIALADSVVPTLADACAIYLIHQSGQVAVNDLVRATRLVCVIDPTLAVAPPAPEVRLQLAPHRSTAKAVRAGQPVLDSTPHANSGGWGERWLSQLDPHSVVAVPIGAPGAVLAVIKFVAVGERSRYQDSDIRLMQEITERAAAVVGRTLRLQRTSEVALALQRGLLSDPPELDGVELRVRYRPAGPGLEVGGDWYDACLQPAGTLALTVGDVVGHDLSAASVMGQLRSMVQALACQPHAQPATTLAAVSRLTQHLQVGEFATVVHGHLTPPGDGAAGHARFTWANAGHPAPLLVCPGEPVRILDRPRSALLGLSETQYEQTSVDIPPGGTLLLFTDGLIEDPDRSHVDTLAELVDIASLHSGVPLDELCDRLVVAAPSRDDIALLAVRVNP